MKDLSESVKWLITFANLGSKVGQLYPQKLLGNPEIKRPPVEPPTISNNHLSIPVTDKSGCDWLQKTDGSLTFCGVRDEFPTQKEFNKFLTKTEISGGKRDDYNNLVLTWLSVIYSIFAKMDKGVDHDYYTFCVMSAESFIVNNYKHKAIPLPPIKELCQNIVKGLDYPHDNTLTQVASAYILDYWHNQRLLHQNLRQCRCCGRFWFEASTRRKYCCKKCKDRFNYDSRQKVRESLREQRKILSRKGEKITQDEIISFLCDEGGYTKENAVMIYKEESGRCSRNIRSLANFKRTFGEREGL